MIKSKIDFENLLEIIKDPAQIEQWLPQINELLEQFGVEEGVLEQIVGVQNILVVFLNAFKESWNAIIAHIQAMTDKKIYKNGFQKGYELLCKINPANAEEKLALDIAKKDYMKAIREVA